MRVAKPTDDERKRIDDLLSSGRIGVEDHRLLVAAVERRSNPLYQLLMAILNPYRLLSSATVLILGTLFIGVLTWTALRAGMYFPSPLAIQLVVDGKPMLTPWTLLAQNLVNTLTLAVFYYIGARLFHQRNLRFLDFVGTVAFATLPFVVFALVHWGVESAFPEFIPRKADLSPTIPLMVFLNVLLILPFWRVMLCYSALKESSGMTGRTLWIVFIAGSIMAEVLSSSLNLLAVSY